MKLAISCALLSLTACIDDESIEDVEDVSTTEQEISVAGGATWGTPGNSGADLMLGNTSQETCFLRGVSGDMRGLGTLPASAEVFPYQGKWFIRTRAGVGTGVMAHVQCINVPYDTAGGIQRTWADGNVPVTVSTAGNRQCYLSGVRSTVGLASSTSRLTVTKTSSSWVIDGVMTGANPFGGSRGGATMVCFNTPVASLWNFSWTAPNPGAMQEVLRNSYPAGPGLTSPEIACGLTEIRHDWRNPAVSFGWDDGFVTLKNTSPLYWKMTASSGKGGRIRCIK